MGAAAASAFVSNSKWCRLAHSQFAVAISAVTHIQRSSRRFRPVIRSKQIAIARTLRNGPNGILKASAFGRNFRKRIKEAHIPAYIMIIDPELSATIQRNVPLEANIHPVNAENKMETEGV